MPNENRAVRPTRRSLHDLGIPVPFIDLPLHELDDELIRCAQLVPEKRDAGGAERIRSLTDRVWFKVKTSRKRAAVTEVVASERPAGTSAAHGSWWIGAVGLRKSDSPRQDFYERVLRECTHGRVISSQSLLPVEWDWSRIHAEDAVAWRRAMKALVLKMIADSLVSGHTIQANFQQHRISVLVRAERGGEAYLALSAEGIPDPKIFALVLDCVPGIEPSDWQVEPSSVAGISPQPGEIIWSTLLPPQVSQEILELNAG